MLRLRSVHLIRRFCTAPSSSPSPATAVFTRLMNADWVDSDDHLADLTASADKLINDYRATYNPSAPDDVALKEYERLYVAKEAANISDALGDYVEVLLRKHEDMLGPLGDNPEIPAKEADDTVQLLEDYVALVNGIADKEIRRKLELELGRKMVVMRQVLSVHNFSAQLAPTACDHIVTRTKPLPINLVHGEAVHVGAKHMRRIGLLAGVAILSSTGIVNVYNLPRKFKRKGKTPK